MAKLIKINAGFGATVNAGDHAFIRPDITLEVELEAGDDEAAVMAKYRDLARQTVLADIRAAIEAQATQALKPSDNLAVLRAEAHRRLPMYRWLIGAYPEFAATVKLPLIVIQPDPIPTLAADVVEVQQAKADETKWQIGDTVYLRRDPQAARGKVAEVISDGLVRFKVEWDDGETNWHNGGDLTDIPF